MIFDRREFVKGATVVGAAAVMMGAHLLDYAESLGLGSQVYELIPV